MSIHQQTKKSIVGIMIVYPKMRAENTPIFSEILNASPAASCAISCVKKHVNIIVMTIQIGYHRSGFSVFASTIKFPLKINMLCKTRLAISPDVLSKNC